MSRLDVRHISLWVDRDAQAVYDFALRPENLPRWASGLGEWLGEADGGWAFDTEAGRTTVRFVARNPFGVLDHQVLLASGATVDVPLRVIPNGAGSEITLTLFRQPEMSDADYDRDAAWVERDLHALKALLEAEAHSST